MEKLKICGDKNNMPLNTNESTKEIKGKIKIKILLVKMKTYGALVSSSIGGF